MAKDDCSKRYLTSLIVLLILSAPVAYAVRANWGVRQKGPQMEKMGRHEEAAFYYRAALDFYAAMLQFWIGSVYDEGVDDIYQKYARPFGTKNWRSAPYEERWDTMAAYLYLYNRDGASRNIEKGEFSSEQRARLEDRLRVYMEDLMDPDHGFGGDFAFARKAWILERTGLFWHAALRRELAGRYAITIGSRYCSTIADEMERVFSDPARAELYRQKAIWWRKRGMDELHLCNGDRLLSRLKGGDRLKRLERHEVIAVLKRGLSHENVDARRAAVQILSDLGEIAALRQAMSDREVEIRKRAAAVFAEKMYLPGLALAHQDEAEDVAATAKSVLEVDPQSRGAYLRAVDCLAEGLRDERVRAFAAQQLRRLSGLTLGDSGAEWRDWVSQATDGIEPGVLMECFSRSTQTEPVVSRTLDTVDMGLKFQANFPKVWYDYWDKPEIFPKDAKGPFRLRIAATLYIPVDGNYRFYVKTVIPNRATVSIDTPGAERMDIISPRNDEKLQYVMQAGMPTHRIDFSTPIELKKGLVGLAVDYSGDEVRNIRPGRYDHIVAISGVQKVGIQLFWSSDRHLTELVPAANLFHSSPGSGRRSR